MIKEVLNDFLDCPMASQCLGFWKNYEKAANTKIKLTLTKVARKYLTPPQNPQMLKDCFLQLEIFSQTKETDYFQKIWKNFFFVEKIFQLLDSVINYFY